MLVSTLPDSFDIATLQQWIKRVQHYFRRYGPRAHWWNITPEHCEPLIMDLL